jgi:hypothetical protein
LYELESLETSLLSETLRKAVDELSSLLWSNSLTIFPLPKIPKSPPRLPEGQEETSLAILENFSPFFSLASGSCGRSSELA